jgi:tRNA(adenine34) deaminase
MLQLQSDQACIALDLPGFGLSDKPKKVAAHRLAWHAQVLREFIDALQPSPVVLHAPRVMAPVLHALTCPIEWVEVPELPSAWCEAPYPDAGHMAGPRALRTLLRS